TPPPPPPTLFPYTTLFRSLPRSRPTQSSPGSIPPKPMTDRDNGFQGQIFDRHGGRHATVGERIRTSMPSRAPDPKSGASTVPPRRRVRSIIGGDGSSTA